MCSLLVYRNTTDFCMFTWHPVDLLSPFFSSKRFFWYILWDFQHRWSFHQQIELYFFFHLYFFHFLFLPYCTSKTFQHYVDKRNDSGHPCFVPSIRSFIVKHVSYRFHGDSFLRSKLPSLLIFWGIFFFIMNGWWILSNAFYPLVDIYLIWFSNTETALHPWNEPHLLMLWLFLHIFEFYFLIFC